MDFNFIEIFSSLGNLLFYGGIICAAVSILLILIFIPTFAAAKRKMIRKIEADFNKSEK